MKKMCPYGLILYQYQKANIKLDYAIFVFVGKDAWKETQNYLARGQACLCVPLDTKMERYFWPVNGLNLVLIDAGNATYSYLKEVTVYLLREGAKLIYIETNMRPLNEFYINDIEKDVL